MDKIYFEDISEGEVRSLGKVKISEGKGKAFAQKYGPQSIPLTGVDPGEGISSDLTADGWYVASACMRHLVDEFLSKTANMGMLGLDELVWGTSVEYGELLTVENEILDTYSDEQYDDRGYVRNRTTGYDQNGEEAVRWTSTNIIARR